ncbi:response regulator transcription factor [Nitriliruptoraceae bacterium ZYF776]|nr:response regulator transcription factor [Profundirhabdus halotolerans]
MRRAPRLGEPSRGSGRVAVGAPARRGRRPGGGARPRGAARPDRRRRAHRARQRSAVRRHARACRRRRTPGAGRGPPRRRRPVPRAPADGARAPRDPRRRRRARSARTARRDGARGPPRDHRRSADTARRRPRRPPRPPRGRRPTGGWPRRRVRDGRHRAHRSGPGGAPVPRRTGGDLERAAARRGDGRHGRARGGHEHGRARRRGRRPRSYRRDGPARQRRGSAHDARTRGPVVGDPDGPRPTRRRDGRDRPLYPHPTRDVPSRSATVSSFDPSPLGSADLAPVTPFRVVVADDHTLVRQSVLKAVRGEPGVEVVGEAADGPSTLEAVGRTAPDLVVLDIAMPELDGLEVAERLRRDRPDLRIVFLSMHDDDASLQRATALGATGFVSKSASIEELLEAVRAARDGRTYLSSNVASRVRDLADGRGTADQLGLTPREREILELLTQGHRPGEIGTQLFLSVKTVKNHLTRIYSKLGVETGAQAVAESYRLGIVQRHPS